MLEIFYSLPLTPLHISVLLFTFYWIIKSDHAGFKWILGKSETLKQTDLDKYHKFVFWGLLAMIATGLLLLAQKPYKIDDFNFKIKMFFVFCLFINAIIIGKLMNIAAEKSFKDISKSQKFKLILSGSVSTFCWLGAFLSATIFK